MMHHFTDIRKACAKRRRCTGIDGQRENLATLCSAAWVRSNFPEQGGPKILSTERDGTRLTVHFRHGCDFAELYFPSEEAANKAKNEIRVQSCEYTGGYKLAAGIDHEALSAEMNRLPCPNAKPSQKLS